MRVADQHRCHSSRRAPRPRAAAPRPGTARGAAPCPRHLPGVRGARRRAARPGSR